MKKALIRKDGEVSQFEYQSDFEASDDLYYYAYYSSRPNQDGKFTVFTNKNTFEETRIIYESDDKQLAVQIAYAINNTIRLLAGYYDNSPDKDKRFPFQQ